LVEINREHLCSLYLSGKVRTGELPAVVRAVETRHFDSTSTRAQYRQLNDHAQFPAKLINRNQTI